MEIETTKTETTKAKRGPTSGEGYWRTQLEVAIAPHLVSGAAWWEGGGDGLYRQLVGRASDGTDVQLGTDDGSIGAIVGLVNYLRAYPTPDRW